MFSPRHWIASSPYGLLAMTIARDSRGMRVVAGDFRGTAWAWPDRQPETVQLDDGGHQAEAEAEPIGVTGLVRAIEAFGHRIAFDLDNAGTRVLDPDHGFAVV